MYLTVPLKRKMLVLLNPFGGGGRAIRTWQTAQTMLRDAHIEITEFLTERPKHAFEMVKTIESGYDLIVTVSGDGLAHEVINGLMMRDDWETFKE
jgi:sphingosine kinase